ncbi:MAG: glyceraldehyde-3-phosphate dehydrogenase [SAR86 cluster bacterium]|uniref:Glyceraldehyde-3-phosphate dehydrogenase n=1 Tax=SAR86 cluster bacterium TaxID=2030880 RepID=A0A520MHE7_9GAMM|nr:MAG: glyceraldehyde-3-phosphate dehydrogenase [SAR86 cluster bacterium]|tara:strand:- start:373 stop:1875 length:1503 start_codon:yes stop_codon:yes gene_type:complete
MTDNKDTTFQSTKRQNRILPEDSFGDWKWREGLAELMIPIIGNLYRDGINILVYGKSLVNESPVEIMRAHRFARQSDMNELSELETFPILQYISGLDLADCEIDIGELAVRCPFFSTLKEDSSGLPDFINKELKSVINKDSNRPESPKDIVLYGFGRIGRLVTRMMIQNTGPGNYYKLKAVVIRKASDDDIYKRASLLSRDSVHGSFDGTVRVDEDNSCLVINGNPVKIIYANSPEEVVYSDHGIKDPIVIDNTGVWRDESGLGLHIKSGASKTILTAPAKGDIKNIVFGVNDEILNNEDQIISAASCTTNAIVPVLKVLNDEYGVEGGHIETVHAYTNDQNLIDNFHKGDRRGRGAPLNMVITSTGAVKAVGKAIPELADKLTGNAIRVPTPNVSLAILSLILNVDVDKENLNSYLKSMAFHSKYREIIGYVNSSEIVSTDFYSSPFASIIDSQATITSGNRVTLYCWYDNEYGYSKQVINLAKKVANIELERLPKPIN